MITRPPAGRLVVCSEAPEWQLPQEVFKGSCRLGNTSKSGPGILLLFEDATIQYFDFHEDFRDYEKNSDADYAVNYEKVANVLSIGGLDEGFWAILKEGKAAQKTIKPSSSKKKNE
jgi:hypothetical protein